MGAGNCIGPLLGSLVQIWLSYTGAFYFFTLYIFIIGFGSILFVPARINNSIIQTAAQRSNPECNITYGQILRVKGAVMSIIGCMIAMICLIFMDPTLAVRLSDLGVSNTMVGMAFAIMGACFGLGSPVAGWLCNKFSRKIVM
jgi:predicted MFS family arabinose efflux permease